MRKVKKIAKLDGAGGWVILWDMCSHVFFSKCHESNMCDFMVVKVKL